MRSIKLALPLLGLLALAHTAAAADDAAVTKPIKTTIGSIRYGKDPNAIAQFAGEEQAKSVLGDDWSKGTPAQQKEFVSLFHQLIAKMAFPKFRENFKYLEAPLYEPAKIEGSKAEVKSTLPIMHPLKKQELKVKYDLVKQAAGWKIVDVALMGVGGDSLIDFSRKEISPVMKKSGWDVTLEKMRKVLAEQK